MELKEQVHGKSALSYARGIILDGKYFKRPLVTAEELAKKIKSGSAFFIFVHKTKEGLRGIPIGRSGWVNNIQFFKKLYGMDIKGARIEEVKSNKSNKIHKIKFIYRTIENKDVVLKIKMRDTKIYLAGLYKNKHNGVYYIVDMSSELLLYNLIESFKFEVDLAVTVRRSMLIYPGDYILELEKTGKGSNSKVISK